MNKCSNLTLEAVCCFYNGISDIKSNSQKGIRKISSSDVKVQFLLIMMEEYFWQIEIELF